MALAVRLDGAGSSVGGRPSSSAPSGTRLPGPGRLVEAGPVRDLPATVRAPARRPSRYTSIRDMMSQAVGGRRQLQVRRRRKPQSFATAGLASPTQPGPFVWKWGVSEVVRLPANNDIDSILAGGVAEAVRTTLTREIAEHCRTNRRANYPHFRPSTATAKRRHTRSGARTGQRALLG